MKAFRPLLTIAVLGLSRCAAATKAVFAHFMVDNADGWDEGRWTSEIVMAQTANIDAFALNMPAGSSVTASQVSNAFIAANSRGFKLFFSFDYAGNGTWAKDDVLSLLKTYASNGAYFLHDGVKPLVSTFEGPGSAADWVEIKATIGCFFIPDWSSIGAGPAVALENGVADGLFSWAAWSYGGLAMDTYTDASYLVDLKGKPYMMAVSPWFYTNLPGYKKNWMWPVETMSLWADRWNQVLFLQPDYVEIISWNDFGESHYIGSSYPSKPFEDAGLAAFDYVTDMDHSALRYPLAVWAAQYKNDIATVTEESLVLTYLQHDVTCNDGGTVINTATQLQQEFLPNTVLGNRYIGYMATLISDADIVITVGGHAMAASWLHKPSSGVGVYSGYVLVPDGVSGPVSGTILRDHGGDFGVSGNPIGGCAADGHANFNLFVTGGFGAGKVLATTASIKGQVCTSGTGVDNGYAAICQTSCGLGYCPTGACVCTGMGPQPKLPAATGAPGFAKSDTNYQGLCGFLLPYGFSFPEYCSTTEQTLTTPSVSPFLPPACTSGGRGPPLDSDDDIDVDGLCQFLCHYGYCPIRACSCSSMGVLNPLQNVVVPDDTTELILPLDENLTLKNMDDLDEGGPPSCDFTLKFDSLAALAAVADNYTPFCNEVYALDILGANMSATLTNYNAVNDDYEKLFGYYVTYIKDLIQPSIDDFMEHGGWKYFTCSPYCLNPGSVSDMERPDNDGLTIKWTLSDADGFWNTLQSKYGIEKDWVQFGESSQATGCGQVNPMTGCTFERMTWENYPIKAKTITVVNPKDIWTASASTLNGLPDYIEAILVDVLLGQWDGNVQNPVEVVQLPVSLAAQTVAAMQQVKILGAKEKKLEDEEKKNIISLIVTAVLCLVPFVGEEAAAIAGLASLARGIAIAGELANVGFDIYSIVQDPSSAAMTILGSLGGIGGLIKPARKGDQFYGIGATRAAMGGEIGKMGSQVADDAALLKRSIKSCYL